MHSRQKLLYAQSTKKKKIPEFAVVQKVAGDAKITKDREMGIRIRLKDYVC